MKFEGTGHMTMSKFFKMHNSRGGKILSTKNSDGFHAKDHTTKPYVVYTWHYA